MPVLAYRQQNISIYQTGHSWTAESLIRCSTVYVAILHFEVHSMMFLDTVNRRCAGGEMHHLVYSTNTVYDAVLSL